MTSTDHRREDPGPPDPQVPARRPGAEPHCALLLAVLALTLCLWTVYAFNRRVQGERALRRAWTPVVEEISAELPGAPDWELPGDEPLHGPVLPMRHVLDAAPEAPVIPERVIFDLQVYEALPPELRPTAADEPPRTVILLSYYALASREYEPIEKSNGRPYYRGGVRRELTRRACHVRVWDLEDGPLGALTIESPDPLPTSYPAQGSWPRLEVTSEDIVRALEPYFR